MQEQLSPDGHVASYPLACTDARLLLDNIPEILGRKTELAGIEAHLAALCVMLDDEVVEGLEIGARRGAFVRCRTLHVKRLRAKLIGHQREDIDEAGNNFVVAGKIHPTHRVHHTNDIADTPILLVCEMKLGLAAEEPAVAIGQAGTKFTIQLAGDDQERHTIVRRGIMGRYHVVRIDHRKIMWQKYYRTHIILAMRDTLMADGNDQVGRDVRLVVGRKDIHVVDNQHPFLLYFQIHCVQRMDCGRHTLTLIHEQSDFLYAKIGIFIKTYNRIRPLDNYFRPYEIHGKE